MMGINSYVLVWTIMQITIACAVALVVAWLSRGSRPQGVSSMLVGAMGGCYLLTLAALIPSLHWSVALPQSLTSSAIETHTTLQSHADHPALSDGTSEIGGQIHNEARPEAIRPGSQWTRHLRTWLGEQFRRVDVRIHDLESTTAHTSPTLARPLVCLLTGLLGIGSALWLISFIWMRSIVRASIPVFDPELNAIVVAHCQKLDIRTPPAVRMSGAITVGATIGCSRSIILLSSDWTHWSCEEREAVLAHELAHVARSDFLWGLVASVFRVLYFYNPFAHLLVRRLRMEQEFAADQLAAGVLGDARAYGRALAGLAIRSHDQSWAMSPLVMADSLGFIRRMIMIKQGRLKPMTVRGRWCGAIAVAATLAVLPLTGLRGTPPDSDHDMKTAVVPADSKESEEPTHTKQSGNQRSNRIPVTPEGLEKARQDRLLQKEVNEKYPKLRFIGKLSYLPGRFQTDRTSPMACWMNAYTNLVLFGKQPARDSEISGNVEMLLEWTDMERIHDRPLMAINVRNAKNFAPGFLTKVFSDPSLGPMICPISEDVVDGHRVVGVGNPTFDYELGKTIEPTEPTAWVLDDEAGYLLGTIDEIRTYLQSGRLREVGAASDSAPLYDVTFDDCKNWHAQFSKFTDGSPRASEFAPFLKLICGLVQFQATVTAQQSDALMLRAVYDSENAAQAAKMACESLIQLGCNMMTDDQPGATSMIHELRSMQIEQNGCCISIPVKDTLASLLVEDSESGAGSLSGPIGWSDDTCPGVAKCDEGLLLQRGHKGIGAFPASLVQNVDATSYRGKRVRLQVESNPVVEDLPFVGLMAWASGKGAESLRFASKAFDNEKDFFYRKSTKTPLGAITDEHESVIDWKSYSIEMDVPQDATVLTFGVYATQLTRDLRLHSVRIESVGAATGETAAQAPASVNLFVPLGRTINPSPINLEFKDWNADDADALDAQDAEVAQSQDIPTHR